MPNTCSTAEIVCDRNPGIAADTLASTPGGLEDVFELLRNVSGTNERTATRSNIP